MLTENEENLNKIKKKNISVICENLVKFQENSELRAPSKCGRIATSYADKQVQEMLQLLAAKQTPDRKQQPPPTKAVGGWGSRQLRYGHEFPPLRFFLQQN